jgi:hypothetical protein
MVVSVMFLFGCATSKVAYEKPGSTEVDRQRDTSECTQACIGHEPSRHVFAPVVVDRAAFEKCLEDRGYSRVR